MILYLLHNMVSTWNTCSFFFLVVIPQKTLMGYFKDGINFISEIEYLFEKRSWKANFGVIYYVPSSFIKSFHLVLISVGLKQEKIQIIVG